MRFVYKRSLPMDYNTQGYIHFVSRMYSTLPVGQQKLVRQLCDRAGGEHREALFRLVTTDTGAEEVCRTYYLSRSTLERCVRRYYILFAQRI